MGAFSREPSYQLQSFGGQLVYGLFEILEILGRKSCLARIDMALERAGGGS